MLTMKEREEIVQTRNKVNLGALKIQNGFHCLQFLMHFFNFTQDALNKSGSGKNLAFTLVDIVYRSAHACNLLKFCKYGYRHSRPQSPFFSCSCGLKTRGAPCSSRVALGMRMGYKRPFIAEKAWLPRLPPFAQPISVRKSLNISSFHAYTYIFNFCGER